MTVTHQLLLMKLKLPDGLSETFGLLALKNWLSTRHIKQGHRGNPEPTVTIRATFNRLQRLRALKLVECRRDGREKLWRRKG